MTQPLSSPISHSPAVACGEIPQPGVVSGSASAGCVTLSAEALELARQISLRRAYLAARYPGTPGLSLARWHRQRAVVITELSDLEKQAIAAHGSVNALLTAAGLPVREEKVQCLNDLAHDTHVEAIHCPCPRCVAEVAEAERSQHALAVLAADSQ